MEPIQSAPLVEASPAPPALPQAAVALEEKPESAPQQLLRAEVAAVHEPAPIVETAPIVQEPAPVIEPGPESVATHLLAAEEALVAAEPEAVPEPIQQVEAAPLATAVAAEPVVEHPLHFEPTPVATAPEPALVSEPGAVVDEPEPVSTTALSVEPEPVVEHVPPITTAPEPALVAEPEVARVETEAEPEPVATAALAVEPEPVVEHVPPVATAPEPGLVAEPEVARVETAAIEAAPEPVAALALAVEPEPIAEHVPHVEAAPVAEPEPEPVAELILPETIEPEPVSVAETAAHAALAEPPPLAQPAPVADLKPAIQERASGEPASEAPIKVHEVPDPLFALAVEIRAVQAARAAALSAPQESAGLLELAGAVGVQSAPIEHAEQVEQAAPVAHSAPTSTSDKIHATEAAVAAVALLAPPEPEKTLILEPVALPPAPLPAIEPVPQPQPVALAAGPQTESEWPALPFAPMQDYTPATSRSIMPVPPPQQILAADSGPRITLPGPALPPELTRLQDANVVTVIGEQTAQRTKDALPSAKRGGAPGWLVSTLVMIVLLAAGLAVVYFLLLPHTVADAKPAPMPAPAATGPAPTGGTSPLAKFVEVTGFRIITSSADASKKAEVQYLVVNHSDADISDANVFITLRSAKPGQAPLCRFSFKIPSLGPFEAKEMSSPIEKSPRALSLPDWQDVRADVQISQ